MSARFAHHNAMYDSRAKFFQRRQKMNGARECARRVRQLHDAGCLPSRRIDMLLALRSNENKRNGFVGCDH